MTRTDYVVHATGGDPQHRTLSKGSGLNRSPNDYATRPLVQGSFDTRTQTDFSTFWNSFGMTKPTMLDPEGKPFP